MITWHTSDGPVAGDDQEAILAQFGPSAFYRPDAFLKPYAVGRILVENGERTAALLIRVGDGPEPTESEVHLAMRRAGLVDRDEVEPGQ